MRQLLAVAAGAAVALLGGLIAGEYPFTGFTPYLAGVLLGVVVAEVAVAVAGRRSPLLGVVAAGLAGAGLAYGAWDDAGYGLRPIGAAAWVGVGVAAVIAGLRGGLVRRSS